MKISYFHKWKAWLANKQLKNSINIGEEKSKLEAGDVNKSNG